MTVTLVSNDINYQWGKWLSQAPAGSNISTNGNTSITIVPNRDGKPAKSVIKHFYGFNSCMATYIISPGIDIKTIEDKNGKVISREQFIEKENDIIYGAINPIEEEALSLPAVTPGIASLHKLIHNGGYRVYYIVDKLQPIPYNPSGRAVPSWDNNQDLSWMIALNEKGIIPVIRPELLNNAREKIASKTRNKVRLRELFQFIMQ